jgi:16S rRNA (guanine527-N7)-methyltransferase
MEELLRETRDLVGITLTAYQISLLERFMKELDIWNERYNLTAINEPDKIRVKHFLDSFSPMLVMKGTSIRRLIDVGTGAGFPGIPLKIILPETEVVLVDSVAKKTEFCQHIIDILDLKGIKVVHDRAERLGRLEEYREKFDWAMARAVARMSTLSEYLLPLVKVGGRMLAMKGDQGPSEAQEALPALSLLGGDLQQIRKLILPGVTEDRYLITVRKKASTPEKYPRKAGIPTKRPL